LKHINLTIKPGQTVGFLGATGSGKSSLVNLVPRFYDVLEGKVLIDGVDVRDIPQDQLHQAVGGSACRSPTSSPARSARRLSSEPRRRRTTR
ncbi:MAG: ATP-binding cassette domain-containing protein, partial [Chloroflexi bacterium]|nr:ATP-binding cassette domain-containing protein [Chloroflexota bacterium]